MTREEYLKAAKEILGDRSNISYETELRQRLTKNTVENDRIRYILKQKPIELHKEQEMLYKIILNAVDKLDRDLVQSIGQAAYIREYRNLCFNLPRSWGKSTLIDYIAEDLKNKGGSPIVLRRGQPGPSIESYRGVQRGSRMCNALLIDEPYCSDEEYINDLMEMLTVTNNIHQDFFILELGTR